MPVIGSRFVSHEEYYNIYKKHIDAKIVVAFDFVLK
jgi:hypothetical protein